jgi:hypothetical protein
MGKGPDAETSFEARSKLNTIVGYADMLASPAFGELNPRQRDFIAEIQVAAKVLLSLVDGCASEDTAYRTAVDRAVMAVRPLAVAKELTIDIAAADGTRGGSSAAPVLTFLLFNAVGRAVPASTVAVSGWNDGRSLKLKVEYVDGTNGGPLLALLRARHSIVNAGGSLQEECGDSGKVGMIASLPVE